MCIRDSTTGDSSYETSAKDNQLKPDSHADKKPVSLSLIHILLGPDYRGPLNKKAFPGNC